MKSFALKVMPYLFWLCLAVLTMLLLMEVVPTVGNWPYWDKVYHLVSFAGLSILGLLAYQNSALLLSTGIAFYGGLIEILQGQVTETRMTSVLDWIADLAGILLALLIISLLKRYFQKANA